MGEMIIEGSASVIELTGDATITMRSYGSNNVEVVAYDWRNHGFGGDCVYILQKAAVVALRGDGRLENTRPDYLRNIDIKNAVYQSSSQGLRIGL